jgi:hypothetical protein
MTPQEFIARWRPVTLSERSACQSHFNDLCELLGQPKPVHADPDGSWYTFERGVRKTTGGSGWADVWMKGKFGWEYKKRRRNLDEAYQQLLLYREDLENPPILVVCDLDRFEIHTNFTGTVKTVHAFDLEGLAEPANLDILRKVFTEPEALRPGQTTEGVTQQAARQFSVLADGMRARNVPAHAAAHFLMKLMFCMFAQDIALLKGKVFRRILEEATDSRTASTPSLSKTRGASPTRGAAPTDTSTEILSRLLSQLFEAMAHGGYFGATKVLHFNGGLFADHKASDGRQPVDAVGVAGVDHREPPEPRGAGGSLRSTPATHPGVIDLEPDEIAKLKTIDALDWSDVEPSVFGTLFERTLDPAKRSQIGAHYTSRADIETLLEPVVMQPLRREWAEVQAKCEKLTDESARSKTPATKRKKTQQRDKTLRDFVERLSHVTILDPACGSGNFLYVALHLLLDLEKEVITYAARYDVGLFPAVRPTQLAGIEINEYAQELASVVIWIGYLQWMHHNGFNPPSNPVLEPIDTIRRMDAILDLSNPAAPLEPEWPKAEFIVGNPPFLGSSLFRERGVEDSYTAGIRRIYELPGKADLCCYWFEKARRAMKVSPSCRVGLLATQAIRHGGARVALDRICADGEIFFARSDQPWVLDGADVRVALIGFSAEKTTSAELDGAVVTSINPDLSAGIDLSLARQLEGNRDIAFEGNQKGGDFDPDEATTVAMLVSPNPNGRPTSDVIVPRANAQALVKVWPCLGWIIDFGSHRTIADVAAYETPFEYVRKNVQMKRQSHSEASRRQRWWVHKRPRPEMIGAICSLRRFIVTPRVGKHRIFLWLERPTVPDSRLFVFAREDDFSFGVLHSRVHELWSLRKGARHGIGDDPTYNGKECFETFPFPEPTDEQREAIAAAARELDRLRENWLNPPEWVRTELLEFPGSVDGPWQRYIDPQSIPDADSKASGGRQPADAQGSSDADQALTATADNSAARESWGLRPTLAGAIGTVKYPRLVPRDEECAKQLKKRTLTNLYNQRPTWLDLAHRKLDQAVFAAYGWDPALSDDELLGALLELNLQRASG